MMLNYGLNPNIKIQGRVRKGVLLTISLQRDYGVTPDKVTET
jgi:hypothetical protein